MAKTIWNEGRVVGFSAYEEYVKKALAEDPESEPASEREWLASSLATGSSMIVKVPAESNTTANNKPHYIDIPFPSDTRLCAANPIYAYFYDGTAVYEDGSAWAVGLAKASQLIENDSSVHPSGSISSTQSSKISTNLQIKTTVAGETSGSGEQTTVTDEVKIQIAQYMKIEDGIVIQPGSWEHKSDTPTEDGAPYSSLEPNMAGYPTLRLLVNGRVENDFQVLMTAFTNRIVVMGESTLTADTGRTDSPQDGDYLGPATFPWCAKVFFNVSPAQIGTGNAIYSSNDDGLVNNGNIHIEKTDDGYEIMVKKQITSVSESGSHINSSGDYTTTTDNEHKVSNPALTVKPLDNEQKNHTELTWGREVLREETNPSYNSIIDEDTNLLDMTPNAETKPEENKYGDSIALNIRKAVYSYPDSVMRNYLTIGHFTTHNITSVSSTGAIDSSIASTDNSTQPQYKGNSYIDNAFVAITADNAKNIVADNVGSAVSVNATGDGITLSSTKSTSSSGVTFTITGSLSVTATVNGTSSSTDILTASISSGKETINLNTKNLIVSTGLTQEIDSYGRIKLEPITENSGTYVTFTLYYRTIDANGDTQNIGYTYDTSGNATENSSVTAGNADIVLACRRQNGTYSGGFAWANSASDTMFNCGSFTHTPPDIRLKEVKDSAGNLIDLIVSIGSSSSSRGRYLRRYGPLYADNGSGENAANFDFLHTSSLTSTSSSGVVTFTDDGAKAALMLFYFNKSEYQSLTSVEKITTSSSNIWNVAGSNSNTSMTNRTSWAWTVSCQTSSYRVGSSGVTQVPYLVTSSSGYTHDTAGLHIIIYASSIADGHNSSYGAIGTTYAFDTGHLNMTMSLSLS